MRANNIDPHVHVGLWTNWSRGAVMGSTLTLTREQGNLLIAFTASFIGFASIQFWHIICIACHRRFSTRERTADWTWHQQRQVILRNSSSPESAVVTMLSLISAWWGQGGSRSKVMGQMAPVLFLAITTWLMFTVAGGFSSKIASTVGDDVLLKSDVCRQFALPQTADSNAAFFSQFSTATSNAVDYARQCYSDNASGLVDCGRFTNSTIGWGIDKTSTCPFEDSICYDESIRLDTGHVHSAKILGLNLPPDQDMSIRYALECAPLHTQGFTSNFTTNKTTLIRYHYGHNMSFNASSNATADYVYQMADINSQYERFEDPGFNLLAGYQFKVVAIRQPVYEGKPANNSGQWVPIPELLHDDADVSIVFLSGNGVHFGVPFADAWYRGTVRYGSPIKKSSSFRGYDVYLPQETASPLGCIEQFQICNLGNSDKPSSPEQQCGPLASFYDAFAGAAPKFNTTIEVVNNDAIPSNNRDATRLWWLYKNLSVNGFSYEFSIDLLGGNALYTHNSQIHGIQYDVPRGDDDDGKPAWQLDVIHFYTSALASIQAIFVNSPLGNVATNKANDEWGFPVPDNATDLLQICNSQMARSSAYTSFSMFGLCFTFVLGTLIVLVSATLEPFLKFFNGRWGYKKREHMEWTANSALQLHRLAQEATGYGPWSRCNEKVPVTDVEARLGLLDQRDEEHPVILRRLCEADDGKEDSSYRRQDVNKNAGVQVDEEALASSRNTSEHDEDEIHASPVEETGRDR